MDIEDAFTQGSIEFAHVELDKQEEKQVRKIVRGLAQAQNEEWEHIAVFAFMAGRAYQSEVGVIQVEMTMQELADYNRYLIATRGM